jgi:recombination protein RecA
MRGIVIKAGAWYKYNDAPIGQGEENASEYLFQNSEVMAEIVAKVLKC